MTEEKIKSGKAGPGRPKGSKKKPRSPGQILGEGKKEISVELEAKERLIARRREAASQITRAAYARAAAKRAVLQTVDEDHPCLRYLKKNERLAWLALQVWGVHEKENVVSMGPGMGYEIVNTGTQDPNFKAMELLMRACGDFAEGARTLVQVNGGGGGGAPQIVRKTILYLPPGRGPVPPEAGGGIDEG